jgi:hypothetical protein
MAAAQYSDDLDWEPDCSLDGPLFPPCEGLTDKHVVRPSFPDW